MEKPLLPGGGCPQSCGRAGSVLAQPLDEREEGILHADSSRPDVFPVGRGVRR